MIAMSGYEYHCSANDSFDGVALMVYGDEKYAADIMNANPKYSGMTVFDGGEVLQLPALDVPEDDEDAMANTIAPWKA